ncbi:hypothetical protein SAMN05428970_3075 [Agromyces sp. CF514]|uniref:hypothetical protein n=1 Tax=Agromyces sp. CF514 TaxID=1881031 RepID=UPI0008EE7DD4|nr:hypothetical protein [Agromyces sp. CF514]SFR84883.1 hypothetical protein SAMN05428970_3075 [Agromyces sp. CF514]
MSDGLWWVPSLVVAGVAVAALVGAVLGFRRLGHQREQAALAASRPLEIEAKSLIVQADTAVRDGLAEVAYAEAQFDEPTARTVRAAVDSAQRWLREAFLLQQRLDDADPDTAAERRTWSARIVDLCRQALRTLDEADAALAARRRAEHGASVEGPAMQARARELAMRRREAAGTLERLARRYARSALGGAYGDLQRADLALAAADERLAEAAAAIAGARPAAAASAGAAEALDRAERALGAVDAVEAELAAATEAESELARRLELEASAARAERDGAVRDAAGRDAAGRDAARGSGAAEGAGPGGTPRAAARSPIDAGAGDALATAIAEANAALASRAQRAADPFAARDRLRIAHDRLDAARAAARAAQSRLDGATRALGGALAIAESQLRAADAAIAHGGTRVGADARTRLAEAERQLAIARREPDPVAALDAARRATSRASDAEALAAYDAMQG